MNRNEIKKYLPGVFQRTIHEGNSFSAVLGVMELLHAPAERILDNPEVFFDARRTPAEFVPFLARWVNLDRVFSADGTFDLDSPLLPKVGFLRELVASAAYLSQWRGTKKGLLLFLQTTTGERDFEIDERVRDEDGQIKPFHLKIRAPRAAEAQIELMKRIIESEKPVHLTYELEFR